MLLGDVIGVVAAEVEECVAEVTLDEGEVRQARRRANHMAATCVRLSSERVRLELLSLSARIARGLACILLLRPSEQFRDTRKAWSQNRIWAAIVRVC